MERVTAMNTTFLLHSFAQSQPWACKPSGRTCNSTCIKLSPFPSLPFSPLLPPMGVCVIARCNLQNSRILSDPTLYRPPGGLVISPVTCLESPCSAERGQGLQSWKPTRVMDSFPLSLPNLKSSQQACY